MSEESMYKLSNLKHIQDLIDTKPTAAHAFLKFEDHVYGEGHLPLKIKELIAVAVAHVTQCPYCIDVHVEKFKAAGGTKEEMIEAVMVAGAVRAGGTLAHGVNALMAFDRSAAPAAEQVAATNESATADKTENKNNNTPDCLC